MCAIQVIAGAPNVSKLLDKSGVEYIQRTAGEYKRTINILTPNTEEGLKKFEEDIQVRWRRSARYRSQLLCSSLRLTLLVPDRSCTTRS